MTYHDDYYEEDNCEVCGYDHPYIAGKPRGCPELAEHYADLCSRDNHRNCLNGPYKGHWADFDW